MSHRPAFDALSKRAAARVEQLGRDATARLLTAASNDQPLSADELLESGWLLQQGDANAHAARALEAAEAALRREEPGGERQMLALVVLAHVLNKLGEHDRATRLLETALEHLDASPEPSPIRAVAHANLGAVMEHEGRRSEAAAVLGTALDEYTQLGLANIDTAVAAFASGRVELALSHPDIAVERLRYGLQLTAGNAQLPPIASVENQLMLVAALVQASRPAEATATLEEALATAREIEPSEQLLSRLLAGGQLLANLNEHKQALSIWHLAMEVDRALRPSGPPRADIEQNLGVSLGALGDLDDALEHLGRALERADSPPLRAAILSNLGDTHRRRGELARAMSYLSQADALQRTIDPRSREAARKRNNLGLVYDAIGLPHLALLCASEALDLHQEADQALGRPSGDTANTMSGVGKCLARFGELDAAREHYERGLAIWQELAPNSHEVAAAYTQLGNWYLGIGNRATARTHLEEAVRRFEALSARTPDAADAFNVLGGLEGLEGRLDQARERMARSLALRRELGVDGVHVAMSLRALGELDRREGNLDDGVRFYEEGVSAMESSRAHAGHAEARVASFSRNQGVYQELIAALHERGNGDDHARAFAIAERSRSRTLLDLMASRSDVAPAELVEIEDHWAEVEEALRAVETAGEASHEEMYQLALEVGQAEEKLNQARARLAALPSSGDGQHAAARRPLGLGEAQALLDDRTLLLEYDATGEETFVWAARHEMTTMAPLGVDGDTLTTAVRWIVGAYDRRSGASRATRGRRQALAEALLGPVPSEFWEGVERLFVVPDGALHQLPFDLLPFGDPDELLLDRVAIASAPSASVAALLSARPAVDIAAARLVAFGDPAPTADRSLEGARREVEAVAQRFPGRAKKFIEEQATKAQLAIAAPQADVLHFATHGEIDDRDPLHSGLVFRDGLLKTHEIPRTRLEATLVVCSACETGVGSLYAGEGLLGLTRALLGAGARCVVASLWPVHDAATEELMVGFYDRLVAGEAVPEALRGAKLEVRRERPDPYYWSAFVPVGSAF